MFFFWPANSNGVCIRLNLGISNFDCFLLKFIFALYGIQYFISHLEDEKFFFINQSLWMFTDRLCELSTFKLTATQFSL